MKKIFYHIVCLSLLGLNACRQANTDSEQAANDAVSAADSVSCTSTEVSEDSTASATAESAVMVSYIDLRHRHTFKAGRVDSLTVDKASLLC